MASKIYLLVVCCVYCCMSQSYVHNSFSWIPLLKLFQLIISKLFVILAFFVAVLGQSSEPNVISRIDGPAFAERGKDVTLTCVYDLGANSLFVIEWFFNNSSDPIYWWVPGIARPKKYYISGLEDDIYIYILYMQHN